MLTPGHMLGGRYRLEERIATGGMGEVWRAEDTVLGRRVAVKILQAAMLEESGFAQRFRAEARVMATINHPGVVQIYDYGEGELQGGGKAPFLVMEYVEGEPLHRVLVRAGRLPGPKTMDFVAQAAEALQAAHDHGIVHRDVKPGNLLIRPNGKLVLTDFGIARSAISGNLTQAGAVLGTASYVSPEQAAGSTITPASDLYSLGVVAYQCLTGRRPFEGDNPIEVAMKHIREMPPPLPPDVPPEIRAVVERAMAKDPVQRWESASAMAEAARRAAAGESVASPSGTSPGTPGRTAVMPTVVNPTVAGTTRVQPPVSPAGVGFSQPAAAGGSGQPRYARGAASVTPPTHTADDSSGYYQEGSFNAGPSGSFRPSAADSGRRNNSMFAVAAGVVVLLLGVSLVVYVLLRGDPDNNTQSGDPTPSAALPSEQSETQTVFIDQDQYLGARVEEVVSSLVELGFQVENISTQERDGDRPPGRVNGVEPNGEVSLDEQITVYYDPIPIIPGNDPNDFPTAPHGDDQDGDHDDSNNNDDSNNGDQDDDGNGNPDGGQSAPPTSGDPASSPTTPQVAATHRRSNHTVLMAANLEKDY